MKCPYRLILSLFLVRQHFKNHLAEHYDSLRRPTEPKC